MLPSPEILGLKFNWFELITVLSILTTLLFGRWFFYSTKRQNSLSSFLMPLGFLLALGYFAAYAMAYIEGQTYTLAYQDVSRTIAFGEGKKFLGFIFLIYVVVLIDKSLLKLPSFSNISDFLAVVVCLFIVLEANACLLDGHGCYGRFTNLPWGMYFLHGSAPTLFPVHPTPIYISLSHLLLFFLLLYLSKKDKLTNRLILVLILGTSSINFMIEFTKDTDALLLSLNFSQSLYGLMALTSFMLLIIPSAARHK